MSEINSDFHRLQYAQTILDLAPSRIRGEFALFRMHLVLPDLNLGQKQSVESRDPEQSKQLRQQLDCLEASIERLLGLLPVLRIDREALLKLDETK
jgi:hypothetical protein